MMRSKIISFNFINMNINRLRTNNSENIVYKKRSVNKYSTIYHKIKKNCSIMKKVEG